MPIFVVIITVSLSLYIFYKVKEWRIGTPHKKRWAKAKANIALGIFVLVFGVNRLFIYESVFDLVIGGLFLVLGSINIFLGYRAYKHYLPLAIEEGQHAK